MAFNPLCGRPRQTILMTTDDTSAPEIGPALRRQRKASGLTLEELAARSGVSRSMLSQIERGEANPTFAVLWSLTRALKIAFNDLLEAGAAPADESGIELVSVGETPEIRNPNGTCRLRILSPPQLAGEMEWYAVEIAPSGSLESAPHAPGAFEHLTALSAGLEVTAGGTTQALKVGETARYPADVPHRVANRSVRTVKGLMVVLYR